MEFLVFELAIGDGGACASVGSREASATSLRWQAISFNRAV